MDFLKRKLAFILALVIPFSCLAGCKSNDKDTKSESSLEEQVVWCKCFNSHMPRSCAPCFKNSVYFIRNFQRNKRGLSMTTQNFNLNLTITSLNFYSIGF